MTPDAGVLIPWIVFFYGIAFIINAAWIWSEWRRGGKP